MAMSRENALRKIRSLARLAAPGSGATPAERATAKALALKLMKAYGLAPKDFGPQPARRPTAPTVRASYSRAGVSVNFSFDDDFAGTNSTDSTSWTGFF